LTVSSEIQVESYVQRQINEAIKYIHRKNCVLHTAYCILPTEMKIVRIIARLNVGGPARHVVWLTAGLPKDEFEQLLVAGVIPQGEDDMSYFATQHGIEPLIIPQMSRELSLKDIITLWKVYRLLLKEKPDIIHTHTAKAGTIGRVAGFIYRWFTPKTLIGKPRNVRFVHTFHGHVFHSYYGAAKTKFFLAVEKMLARFVSDKIVVLSEQQCEEINGRFKVGKKNQFEIIPLGIDLTIFQNSETRRNILRDEIGAKDDEILIGIVGRLTEIKNHSLFLRIAARVKELKPTMPIRFLIIGDGHLRSELEKEAKDLKLDNWVLFLGERTDPQNFYPALDVVALTSLNEGTPLTLIEAMANSCPAISTSVGGVVDLLGKESSTDNYVLCERGIRVPSQDVETFSQGLIRLIEDKNLRYEIGKRGESFIFDNYSKERLLVDIGNLYRKLNRVSANYGSERVC
jgi:glycosyltransferase involved in cell wall biosynthesis